MRTRGPGTLCSFLDAGLAKAGVATLALTALGCSAPEPPAQVDVWIRGGTVVDGTGAPGRAADVLVRGDRIVFVGKVADTHAATIVDATGRVVAPGFIDAHAHGEPLRAGAFENFLAMGVTTICLGQDGSSPGRGDLAAWLRAVDGRKLGPNIAPFAGHGTLRKLAGIGDATDPGEEQLARLEQLVRDDLAAGAFGLTTGLEYEPGRFANKDELARIAKPVGEAGGVVMSHLRSEDDGAVEPALAELLAQCEAGRCRAHVSHLKIVYGRDAARADALLAAMQRARDGGLQVSADFYPYLASYTGIGIVFPEWARPPNDWERVKLERRAELAAYLRERVTARNGPAATVFGSGPFAGRSLESVAQSLGEPFEEVLIDDVGPDGGSAAYFVMSAPVQDRLVLDPAVVISSDGSPTMPHPRGYGAFARVIRDLVVERELLTLEQAVHKMSGATAAIVGLKDRGVIADGNVADLVVFDPRAVSDRATFEKPFALAEGFDDVLVNGVPVRAGGKFTGARPGRVLRRVALASAPR